MASPLSQKTLDKVTLYANKHHCAKACGFSPALHLRVMIAEQLFQLYASGRVPMTRQPRKVIPEIASRVYRLILSQAAIDPEMAMLRDECHITEGKKRTYFEMSNDIAVYEVFRHIWGVDTSNHAKAVCEEGAYELIEMGHANADPRALASGLDRLSKLHNDFQEAAEDFANTADTEITFSSDVQIVRPDAENMSREAIEKFKKKYGAFVGNNIEDLVENEEGVFVPQEEPEEDDDFFVKAEEREFARKK